MTEQTKDSYFLAGIIDRFEDKMAIIKIKGGQELKWPIKDLPPDCEKGVPVRIVLTTGKTDEEDRGKIARTILNKILETDQEDAD